VRRASWGGDLIRCPVQNIKQQWFQDFRGIVPTVEIEGLKAFERRVSSALTKRKPYCPPRVQRWRRSFNSPMMFPKFEIVR
jgi:hypothetical protein